MTGVAGNPAHPRSSGVEPLIAICMATRNPDRVLFERQLETIQTQTHARFVCLVNDDESDPGVWAWILSTAGADARFICSRNTRRLGFYRNFERCLELVPPDADYVAFADQDDAWHPDKLATLLDAIEKSGALLAYSDMNVVSVTGGLLASTRWSKRSNNFTDLGSLVVVNTVTGAASLFRRELLEDALPFPPEVGPIYHDHWLACVALALGELAYVDRPLYDYVQHEANVAGHDAEDFRSGLLHMVVRFLGNPPQRLRNTVGLARRLYVEDVRRIEVIARTLEAHLGTHIRPERADDVRRLARLSSSPRSLAWLLGRSLRDPRGRGSTMGLENQLLKGVLWRHSQVLRAGVGRRSDPKL